MVATDLLDDAREALRSADYVVPHTDADGLAAGALALRARGEHADAAVLVGRGRTPFEPAAPVPPGSLAVLDWGVRPLDGAVLFVDHHAPEAMPAAGQVVVSGYGERPETTTAALMRRVLPDQPSWLAAVGAVGDLGDAGFQVPEAAGAARAAVRNLVPLINAPRRVPDGPVRVALALLVEHDDPREVFRDERATILEECKRAWRDAFDRALRTAPAIGPRAAVVRFSSPYQVHPLVATTWARRLAPRPVIAANDGYLPGRVNFAVRGGDGDLRALLRAALPDVDGEFAHGHDRATGGSIDPIDFDRLVEALGGLR